MDTTKVSELTVTEFKVLIRDTVIDTVQNIIKGKYIPYVDDDEQNELESMFGKKPYPQEFISKAQIEL